MKKLSSLLLSFVLLLVGCSQSASLTTTATSTTIKHSMAIEESSSRYDSGTVVTSSSSSADSTTTSLAGETGDDSEIGLDLSNYSDPNVTNYLEDKLYLDLVDDLANDGNYYVEEVRTSYVSKEYIDELGRNSQPNVYFGYTLEEIDKQFHGSRYVFTLGDDGQTDIKTYESYDGAYEKILTNVAIGAGVIIVCVVVAVVTDGAALPAECETIHLIFAAAAEGATITGLTSGAISGGMAGAITGYETGDFNKALKAGLVSGSEGFASGAIIGAVSYGASEGAEIFTIARTYPNAYLSAARIARIQKESKYPIELIANIQTQEEYALFKEAGLVSKTVLNRLALVRNIDLKYVDKATGLTNLELMQRGNAPIDPLTGLKYELHHIGQHMDSPLAILTEGEHDKVKHLLKETEIDRNIFATQKRNFWKQMAKDLVEGPV